MHIRATSVVLLSLLQGLALAQSKGNFINPPNAGPASDFSEDNVYTIGQTVAVRWSTSIDSYGVYLWQQSPSVGSASQGPLLYSKLAGRPDPGGFTWTVDKETFDLEQSNVFFFVINGGSYVIDSNAITSHYFNLTEGSKAQSTSTVFPSSTVISSSSTVVSTSSAMSMSTSSSSAALPPSTNQSLSNNTVLKISLGVSIGLGVPLIALAAYIAVMIGRKRKRSTPPNSKRVSAATSDPMPNTGASLLPQEMIASYEFPRVGRYGGIKNRPGSEAVELPVGKSGR